MKQIKIQEKMKRIRLVVLIFITFMFLLVIVNATPYDDFEMLDEEFQADINSGELYSEPAFSTGCDDDPLASIYGFNHAFAYQPIVFNFSSTCVNDALGDTALIFPFCKDNYFEVIEFSCNCSQNKCIADASQVFYWIKNFGTNWRPSGRIIDSDFFYSAVNSWIDN